MDGSLFGDWFAWPTVATPRQGVLDCIDGLSKVFAEEPNRVWTGAELAKLFNGVAVLLSEVWGITPTKEKL